MPAALEKQYASIDLPACQDKVRIAMQRAVDIVGGQAELARRLTAEMQRRNANRKAVSPQSLRYWLAEGTFLGEDYWPCFEVVTDFAVTRRHLRPDKYPNG